MLLAVSCERCPLEDAQEHFRYCSSIWVEITRYSFTQTLVGYALGG